MTIIRFVENWGNKLNREVFTTIRNSDEKKKNYYVSHLNKIFQVKLKGEAYCEARLISVWYGKFEDVPPDVLTEDTGLSFDKSLVLFNRFKCVGSFVIVLTFLRIP